jgi:hypothetical protein
MFHFAQISHPRRLEAQALRLRQQILIGLVALAGCATHRVQPDDMSAAKHREEAEREAELARDQAALYKPELARSRTSADASGKDYLYTAPIYNPADGHLSEMEVHRQHAREHMRAARLLEEFEETECRDFPPSSRAACPLLGPVTKIEDIPGGVRVRFKDGVRIDAVVAHMRCHYAYARARGFNIAASCPLYMRGIEIKRAVDPWTVEIVSSDRKTTTAIRARSREEAVLVRGD